VCTRCGGKGHFANECYEKKGEKGKYDLIEEPVEEKVQEKEKSSKDKKRKKDKKAKKEKKEKKEKKHKKE
jgi:hypothetical protein